MQARPAVAEGDDAHRNDLAILAGRAVEGVGSAGELRHPPLAVREPLAQEHRPPVGVGPVHDLARLIAERRQPGHIAHLHDGGLGAFIATLRQGLAHPRQSRKVSEAEGGPQALGPVGGFDVAQRLRPRGMIQRNGALRAADRPVIKGNQPAGDLQELGGGDGLDRGPLQGLDGGAVQGQPLSRMSRALSRCQSRAATVSRLSCSFFPFASAISSFARPLSFQ